MITVTMEALSTTQAQEVPYPVPGHAVHESEATLGLVHDARYVNPIIKNGLSK